MVRLEVEFVFLLSLQASFVSLSEISKASSFVSANTDDLNDSFFSGLTLSLIGAQTTSVALRAIDVEMALFVLV